MWKRTNVFLVLRLLVIVDVVNIVHSLTIDNQLQIIKNDCYERLAIGQRLNQKDVYRTAESKTVADCQKECTQDEDKCRSFSFGIGVKGNATCEISSHVVKETIDLKPIGTTSDTDYDLYIKKLGCKLVIEKKPDVLGSYPGHVPVTSGYDIHEPSLYSTYESHHHSHNGGYNKPRPYFPSVSDHRVQSQLVGIRPSVNINSKPFYYDGMTQSELPQSHLQQHESVNNTDAYDHYDTTSRPNSVTSKTDRPNNQNVNLESYGSSDILGRPNRRRPNGEISSSQERFDFTKRPYTDDFTHHRPSRPHLRPNYEHGYNYDSSANSRPAGYDYGSSLNIPRPIFDGPNNPYTPTRPSSIYDKPTQSHLIKPVHEGTEDTRPPFRPTHLNHPYEGQEQDRPHASDSYGFRPGSSASARPHQFRPNNPNNPGYGPESSPHATHADYDYVNSEADRPPLDFQAVRPTFKPNGYDDRPVLIYENAHGNRRPNYPFGGRPGGLYGKPSVGSGNKISDVYSPKYPHQKPIISETVGPYGQIITSIITEISNVCFRRAMAGRRVVRALVRRSLSCERVEDCQQECGDEKRFVCEGFNYRLDSSGRGRGDCELLEVPYIRLDISRDVLHDPDCDYYEKDRNSSPDCRGHRPTYFRPQGSGGGAGGGSYLPDNDILPPHGGNRPPPPPVPPGGNLPPYGGSLPAYAGSRRPSDRRPPTGRPLLNENRPPYGGDRPPSYNIDRYDTTGEQYGDRYRYGSQYGYGSSGRGNYRDRPQPSGDGGYFDRNRPSYNRRSDFRQSYHSQDMYEDRYSSHSNGYHQYNNGYHSPGVSYLPDRPDFKPPYDYKSYEPYLPSYRYNYNPFDTDRNGHDNKYYRDRERDRNYWGLDKYDRGWGSYGGVYGNLGGRDTYYGLQNRKSNGHDDYFYGRNYNDPQRIGGSKDWGKYGGSYGTGGDYGHYMDGYDYWGLNRRNNNRYDGYINRYGGDNEIPPYRPAVGGGGSYLPASNEGGDLLAPPNVGFSYVNDECSLRSVAGFRLYKGIVKKILLVPSVYECESLCFKETDFVCNSYAYRYTTGLSGDNCYLSDRNYKELDYYTDLEQDRDCDVYTMNNRKQCGQPYALGRDDCFLLARNGHRLDQSCVRDSLHAVSIVECQIECLKAVRFTCRSFTYRAGPSPFIGIIDNCQLTDLPYHDLNPRTDLMPEPGFVLYERRSFGHGCELVHFPVPTFIRPTDVLNHDELCYIGYFSPAKLMPAATRKAMRVENELRCRAECTRCREDTIFHCMSFSYRPSARIDTPNCYLSDIYHRDLTENVDYVQDADSWLFAWDHYNPKCYPLSYNEPIDHNAVSREEGYNVTHILYDNVYGIDTWKMYSVGGWPCKRGTCCRQDREIGFWFCELEGGSPSEWDYCCRPNHQCGYSKGHPYQWCYVGQSSTQWRKCNDKYYPYIPQTVDRDDWSVDYLHTNHHLPGEGINTQLYPPIKPHLPESNTNGPYLPSGHREPRPWITKPDDTTVSSGLQPPHRHSFRPDRPQAPPTEAPSKPSLNEYEMEFDQQFLDPPKPGGFGQPRHWPVSYLHKEKPPNVTAPFEQRYERMEMSKEPQLKAIHNLIEIIKSNDLKNIQYQITNSSNKADDVLYVQIPLPTNFSSDNTRNSSVHKLSQPVDLLPPKDLSPNVTEVDSVNVKIITGQSSDRVPNNVNRDNSSYRKGYIMKTSVANHGRRLFERIPEDDPISLF